MTFNMFYFSMSSCLKVTNTCTKKLSFLCYNVVAESCIFCWMMHSGKTNPGPFWDDYIQFSVQMILKRIQGITKKKRGIKSKSVLPHISSFGTCLCFRSLPVWRLFVERMWTVTYVLDLCLGGVCSWRECELLLNYYITDCITKVVTYLWYRSHCFIIFTTSFWIWNPYTCILLSYNLYIFLILLEKNS